jgi:hypothetical protein
VIGSQSILSNLTPTSADGTPEAFRQVFEDDLAKYALIAKTAGTSRDNYEEAGDGRIS